MYLIILAVFGPGIFMAALAAAFYSAGSRKARAKAVAKRD